MRVGIIYIIRFRQDAGPCSETLSFFGESRCIWVPLSKSRSQTSTDSAWSVRASTKASEWVVTINCIPRDASASSSATRCSASGWSPSSWPFDAHQRRSFGVKKSRQKGEEFQRAVRHAGRGDLVLETRSFCSRKIGEAASDIDLGPNEPLAEALQIVIYAVVPVPEIQDLAAPWPGYRRHPASGPWAGSSRNPLPNGSSGSGPELAKDLEFRQIRARPW